MTTGEKLVKLRKEHGYTQEEFADMMNVSRQSVGKWETDSAYPETEKLIQIGKIYGCSMDYLLKDEITENTPPDTLDKEIEKSADETQSDNEKDGTQIEIELNKDKDVKLVMRKKKIDSIVSGVTTLVCAIVYLLLGFILNLWHPGWIIFFLIIIASSLADSIVKKKPNNFAYPVLAVAVFLLLGFTTGLWHPGWVIFLTIPVYYIFVGIFDRK